MRRAQWSMSLATFCVAATLFMVGLGLSVALLKHASPFSRILTTSILLAWLAALAVLIAAASARWRAFAIAGIVMTWTHLFLDGSPQHAFPTTAILESIWRQVRVKVPNGEIAGDPDDPFGPATEFVPEWEDFEPIGASLASIWLGIGVGAGAYLLRSRRDEAAVQPTVSPATEMPLSTSDIH
jgi:hypothetical protein